MDMIYSCSVVELSQRHGTVLGEQAARLQVQEFEIVEDNNSPL